LSKNALPITVIISSWISFNFPAGSDAKRKLNFRPTKYNLGKFAPWRLCRYFSHNDARLVASRILESDVKVTVCFDFHQNDATSESERVVFNRIRPAPTKNVQWSDSLNCARTSRQKWRISF
jgi:hypothetical protein